MPQLDGEAREGHRPSASQDLYGLSLSFYTSNIFEPPFHR